ncbi:hypothetical protein [Hydrogenophaga sp. PAMC20947]|uniref:hypothetical protein n=1 Tax=Hydrogenophaga sp. PAMC20947 TaxID=2565558 RepID=UPI00109D8720|nr:hypothetical protein [Hydrogenophaga sp. PAMC20947]QCB46433.1 hypothetical protein E5678_10605 [Hydrogenophaga sp. PAMC20947]
MNIQLLQNCIFEHQFERPIPGFEMLDFRQNPHPEWREFQIFEQLYREGRHQTVDVLGAVSSRFLAKGLLDGHEVRRWIEQTPGRDVYFVNPFPQRVYDSFNSSARMPLSFDDPDMLKRFQLVLNTARVPLSFEALGRQHHGNHGMSSYWFGTPRFWERLMTDLVLPVLRLNAGELGSELHGFLYQPVNYYGLAAHRPGALPFLLELATNLYIQAEFSDHALFYSHTRAQVLERCIFPFDRDLVNLFGDEVDAMDACGIYDSKAMAYFQSASHHSTMGALAYMNRHVVNFDHGDPRPHLPWFQTNKVKDPHEH